ncbi:MAG: hypothetical protein RCG15_01150 [Candidatus Rickettsia vulgarisii]
MINKIFISLLLAFNLTSCVDLGPNNITEYEIIPPTTEMGMMCANNCLMMRSHCENNCANIPRHDRQMRRYMKAHDDYLYDDYYRSDNDRCFQRCLTDYHICHQNCGGKVISYQRVSQF